MPASANNTIMEGDLDQEAQIFGFYLIKQQPSRKFIERYARIVNSRSINLSKQDQQLRNFVLAHPWSLGMIDSYLALFNSESELRHRIYIMLAVLEASPEYSAYFLPAERSAIYLLYVIYTGLKAVIKIPFGFALSTIARLA